MTGKGCQKELKGWSSVKFLEFSEKVVDTMSNISDINAQLLGDFGEAWQNLRKQYSEDKWGKEQWREPFELLIAALIYSYNGLINYPQNRLHLPIRPVSDKNNLWQSVLQGQLIPCFTSQNGQELFATMSFASSSFRLCTALFLITKSSSNTSKALSGFLKDNKKDWERDNLVDKLEKATSLGCCSNSGVALTDEIALAIIVAHRDEFGHGEIGKGDRKWVKKRKDVEILHPCRIFQAQLELMKLGLTELAQLTK